MLVDISYEVHISANNLNHCSQDNRKFIGSTVESEDIDKSGMRSGVFSIDYHISKEPNYETDVGFRSFKDFADLGRDPWEITVANYF